MAAGDFEYLGRKTVAVNEGTPVIQEVQFRAQQPDGAPAQMQTRRVVSHLDSAALLLLDDARDEVVLVRRFRPAMLRGDRPGEGWVLELPTEDVQGAGTAAAESPAECAKRAARELLGCDVINAEHIVTLLPNPGINMQRVHMFVGEIKAAPPNPSALAQGKGNQEIVVQRRGISELTAMLDRGELHDATLVVAAQWLSGPRRIRAQDSTPLDRGMIRWTANGREIGMITGPLDDVRDIDVWLNPENTDMQMARVFEPTLSGRIRYLGARKSHDGTIQTDTIADALRQAVADQIFVKPGSVIKTTPGDLHRTHSVKEIFHVASTQYSPNGRPYTGTDFAAEGLRNALRLAEELQRTRLQRAWRRFWGVGPLDSMLVPLLGAGGGGVPAAESARVLVPTVIKHLTTPQTKLRRIYFLAYRAHERAAIEKAITRELAKRNLAWKREPLDGVDVVPTPPTIPAGGTAPVAPSAREPADVA